MIQVQPRFVHLAACLCLFVATDSSAQTVTQPFLLVLTVEPSCQLLPGAGGEQKVAFGPLYASSRAPDSFVTATQTPIADQGVTLRLQCSDGILPALSVQEGEGPRVVLFRQTPTNNALALRLKANQVGTPDLVSSVRLQRFPTVADTTWTYNLMVAAPTVSVGVSPWQYKSGLYEATVIFSFDF